MPVYHLTSPTIISVMFLSGKPCLKCHVCITSHIISVMFLSGKPCLKCHVCIPSHIISVMFLSGKPCLKCHACIPSHMPHHYICDVPFWKALFEVPYLYNISHYICDVPFWKALFEVPCLYTISHAPPLYLWCSFLESPVWSAMSVYHLTSFPSYTPPL